MQPVPVTVASSGWPFATASVRSPSETWSTGPVTDATSPSCRAAPRASSAGSSPIGDRLDAAHLGVRADERRYLACVSAQHGHAHLVENPARRVGAVGGRAGADRIEDDRESHARSPRDRRASIASIQCSESVPMLSTSAEASADHLLDLLARMRHHRQRTEREGRVRRLVHDDVVRDLVDERLSLAQLA